MIHKVGKLVERGGAWWLLFASALLFIVVALYFQFAMGLEPCVKCIYQRVAMFGIALAALLPALLPKYAITRFLGLAGWLVASVWGYLIAAEHAAMQNSANSFFAVCDTFPDFPSWAPLHQWLPNLFAAPGLCGDIDWQFLGLSMPMWLQIIFAAYALVAAVLILVRVLKFHRF
ncbi:MAG: disulfide bond formation protein DsbB [Idiomarina sp.]